MKSTLYSLLTFVFISFSFVAQGQLADQCVDYTHQVPLGNCFYDFEESAGFDFHDEAVFEMISQHFYKLKRNGKINYFREAGTSNLSNNQTVTIFDVHNYFLQELQLERLMIKRLSTNVDEDAKMATIQYQISFIVDGRQGEQCARLKNKFDKKYKVFQHESTIHEHVMPLLEKYLAKAVAKTQRYLRCNN